VMGATCHNVEGLDFELPLRKMVVLTGVSGSGKSTLAHAVLYRNLASQLGQPCQEEPAYVKKITGWDGAKGLERVEIIDQTPLARTPRSTPAVLLGAFTSIRDLFVLAAAEAKLTPGYFSFNSGKGRCARCSGTGFEKVEMQFLSDLFLTCPDCDGKRYTEAALEYVYGGKNVAEVLNLTAREAVAFFESMTANERKEETLLRKTVNALKPLVETGLGYLRLGQPLNTLSKSSDSKKTTLLIMDEPTTGLHFSDVDRLLGIFERLVDEGYSLLVIEHHLDVVRAADHLIEVGPEAGIHGGEVVYSGSVEGILKTATATGVALKESRKQKAGTRASKGERQRERQQDEGMISISGARHHNLKNIDLQIPREEMVVISGLSGSGKSTIAFDILFAEGQRRFLDSMSPYARQFAEQLERPEVDRIGGLPPTVAIEQRLTQYAKLAVQHCPESGEAVSTQTEEQIGKKLRELVSQSQESKSKNQDKKRATSSRISEGVFILAPVIRGRKGFHTDVATAAGRQGYESLFVDGEMMAVEGFEPLARYNEHDIDFVILEVKARTSAKELAEAIEAALRIGKGTMRALVPDKKGGGELVSFSTARVSAATGESFEEPDPSHLSFNSPRGWCRDCRGYGFISAVTTKRGRKAKRKEQEFNSAAEAEIHESLAKIDVAEEEMVACPTCEGDRLKESSRFLFMTVGAELYSLPALVALTVDEALALLEKVLFVAKREQLIARDIVPELTQRLKFLQQVGLGYLSLNRAANTLSGGESQRIRLAAQLGSNLRGVLYILDEPTIGLHPRDNETLLNTLETLKGHGNSLLIVEHDEDTIERAGHVIDLGPGAGKRGGRIVYEGGAPKIGAVGEMKKLKSQFGESPTLQAMGEPLVHPINGKRRKLPAMRAKEGWLRLKGCYANNLKNIDVQIPIGRLSVLTGVSGSGKSSLMRGCLKVAAGKEEVEKYQSASGFEQLKYCYEVDQSPIGKTTRSCPATYVKVFDLIRQTFAQLPEAKARGYTASRFSFNNKEGQCPECKGNGRLKLEMDFLPPSWVPCEACDELRYNPTTLQVLYNGASIGDVLQMSIEQASKFFEAHPRIQKPLQLLAETGLGYLQLGQPSPTLSGGEAQRLKLISELAKGRSKIAKTKAAVTNLYLIEEPTIGLHQQDIKLLIEVLHRLANEGHTVVVIEHHIALAAEADYHLDIGPEAGEAGGKIVAAGVPEKTSLVKNSATAPFLAKELKSL